MLDHIRNQVVLSEIISLRVRLKRRGHEFIGLCPFHKEKSPSFTVNDAKGFYHCFGCKENGDAFSFVQKTQNLPFMEAADYIARHLGLPLPTEFPTQPKIDPDVNAVLTAATAWFETQLHSGARDYLDKRKVLPETRRLFRLGYAPNQGLKNHLMQQGFSEDLQIQAGLLATSDQRKESYERFRNRLMFPIMNRQNQVIAFGGRVLLNGEPKYLNSPETALFQKSKMLYGMHAINTEQRLIVVEGYMDVITLHQAGLPGAVSPLGTALGEEQISLLWRYCKEPLLCFDGDPAGLTASYKVAHKVLPILKPGHTLRFCFLPQGEDPDSLVRQPGGTEVFKELLGNALTLVEVLWRELAATHTVDTPDTRAELHRRLSACWSSIADNSVQHYYRQDLEQRLRGLFFNHRASAKHKYSSQIPTVFTKPLPKKKLTEKILLATLLNHPRLVIELGEELMAIQFLDAGYERIRQSLLAASTSENCLKEDRVLELIGQQEGLEVINELLNEQTYTYAPFARATTPSQTALSGWLHVWEQFIAGDQMALQVSDVMATENFDEQAWGRLKHLKMSLEKSFLTEREKDEH